MLAAILGAGPMADAFFVALRLPNSFRAIFAEGAFNTAFIPAYAHVQGKGGVSSARLFSDRIFTLLFLSQVVLLIVVWLFMPQALSILAPGYTDDPRAAPARDRTDPNHLSLSAADYAGDALWRHPQRDAPLRQRGGGLYPAQYFDDGGAGAGGAFFRPPATPRRGAFWYPAFCNISCSREICRGMAACRDLPRSSSTRTCVRSSVPLGPRRSVRWGRR